jgi:hypothetical protein
MNRAKFVLGTIALLLAVPCLASAEAPKTAAAPAYNHDMSAYKKLAEDALKLAQANNLAAAYPKTKELEKVWDKGTEDLKKAELKLWTEIDDQMDVAIDATNPAKGGTKEKSTKELQKWLDMLAKVPAK